MLAYRLWLGSISVVFLAGCLSPTEVKIADRERHGPSGTSPLLWKECAASASDRECREKPDLTFAAYAAKTEKAIEQARDKVKASDAYATDAHREAALVAPHEWTPDSVRCKGRRIEGVLLVHGLTDTPYLMRDLGEFFADRSDARFKDRCFLVRSVLLPGHGMVPGDLSDRPTPSIDWSDHWVQAVRYGVRSLEKDLPDKTSGIWLVGFSTGAALSVHHALSPQAARVNGLILISPAIRPKSRLAVLADLHRVLYSWAYVEGEWSDLHADRDPVKYESFAKHAGWELFKLDVAIEGGWFSAVTKPAELDTPVFMAISCQDDTVDAPAAIDFFNTRLGAGAAQNSRLVVYRGASPAADQKKRDKEYEKTNEACEASYARTPQGRRRVIPVQSLSTPPLIADLPHIALPIAPGNGHYGIGGDYRNCLHYLEDKKVGDFEACRRPESEILLGEKLPSNLQLAAEKKGRHLARLGFNPHFDEMTEQIASFVKGAASKAPSAAASRP